MLPTTQEVLGFFNLFVGIMLVASMIFFFGGFVQYLIRLGTWPTYRTESVNLMQWGVSILFTLIILLAIQQFLLKHLLVAVSGVSFVIVVAIIWVIVKDLTTSKPKEEEH